MEDFVVLIAVIVLGIVASVNKKNKRAQKGKRAMPGGLSIPYAPNGAASVKRDEQFEKDMRTIRARAQEKLAARKAAQSVPVVPAEPATMLPPRMVEPVVDHDTLRAAGDAAARPQMQPRVGTDTPAPMEPMEGVDPCHDALYEPPRPEERDAYEPETLASDSESGGAAQELMRGIILSEVLRRPSVRWRSQHR